MNGFLFFKIAGIIIACFGACIDIFFKDNWKPFRATIIIFGFGMAAFGEWQSSNDSQKEYSSIVDSLSSTLYKNDSILNLSNKALNYAGETIFKLDSLRGMSVILNDSLTNELQLQRTNNLQTLELLNKAKLQINNLEEIAIEQKGSADTPYLTVGVQQDVGNDILKVVVNNGSKYSIRNVKLSYFDTVLYNLKLKTFERGVSSFAHLPANAGIVDTSFTQVFPKQAVELRIRLPKVTGARESSGFPIGPLRGVRYQLVLQWATDKVKYFEITVRPDEDWIWSFHTIYPIRELDRNLWFR